MHDQLRNKYGKITLMANKGQAMIQKSLFGQKTGSHSVQSNPLLAYHEGNESETNLRNAAYENQALHAYTTSIPSKESIDKSKQSLD